jgi:hypothetical protein
MAAAMPPVPANHSCGGTARQYAVHGYFIGSNFRMEYACILIISSLYRIVAIDTYIDEGSIRYAVKHTHLSCWC